jgi:uncharacterized damage-inducible protein DinB
MISPAYVRTMALYNSEMNRRIYAGAARLGDDQRRADRGLFWRSLHGTLSHLMWGDRHWMSRLDGWPPDAIGQKESAGMFQDFGEMRAERIKADDKIETLANRIDQAWLDSDLIWFSETLKKELRRAKGQVMMHFFNHQTHHRGQAHAALTMCGVDPGDTDLPVVVPPT